MAIPVGRRGWGVPPEGPIGIGIPSQVTYWSWEVLLEHLHGLGVPPGGPIGVGRPSRRADDYFGGRVGVGMPSWRASRVLEAILEGR